MVGGEGTCQYQFDRVLMFPVPTNSKVIRKSIARVLTVYNQTQRVRARVHMTSGLIETVLCVP